MIDSKNSAAMKAMFDVSVQQVVRLISEQHNISIGYIADSQLKRTEVTVSFLISMDATCSIS